MKKLLLVSIIAGMSVGASAQDVHFTQYFTSPLTLNPAQTGLVVGDWRASANYRTQWYKVSDYPYMSGTVSYDMPLLRGKLPEGDALGVGLLVLYDKSGTGGLQNITGGLSFAYHKALGAEKQHTLSLGVQGYFTQKSINFDKLVFADQLNPAMPEAYLQTAESFGNSDVTYPDFNAGLMYTGRINDHSSIYAGFSFYHISQPEEKFLNSGTSATINSRYTGYLGGSFAMNDNVVLYASGLYQKQGGAQEILVGGAVGFVLNPMHEDDVRSTIFYLGSWYRFNDAIAPYVGFEFSKMQIGLSYDVTVSKAQPMSSGQGAYELSLIYNGMFNKVFRPKYNYACPKF